MTVPFEVKECAKPNTEIGHVDMGIVLTVISNSRSGLLDGELDTVFGFDFANSDSDDGSTSMVLDDTFRDTIEPQC
eukprot:m.95627 g.95627  ORF g.95627 m.95627 type:complete len:76 (-) comp16608_c0_seq3:1045-1272(-)